MSRVRIIEKSGCMDIDAVMSDSKATSFVRKLRKIQNHFIASVSLEDKSVPDWIDQSFKIKIEPAGKSLN